MCRVKRHGRPKVRGLGQGGRQFQPSFCVECSSPSWLGKASGEGYHGPKHN